MILNLIQLWTKQLSKTLKESHLEGKIKFQISDVDHVGAKFKNAVKEAQSATFLNDATHIIAFKEDIATTEQPKDDNTEDKENKEENTDTENTDPQDTEKEENTDTTDTEDTEENVGDEDKDEKKSVNENIKVQDLNKSSFQSVKATPYPSTSSKKTCCKESEKECKKDSKDTNKKTEKKNTKDAIEEAETTASGAELKKKVIDNVIRCFYMDQNKEEEKVELYDLEDYIEGANIYFCKISVKEKESTTDKQ